MPADGSTSLLALNGKQKLDLERILVWKLINWEEQYKLLASNPPLRSVVVEIHPDAAEQMLRLYNVKNRRLTENHAKRLGAAMAKHSYERTGDTIKVSRTHKLLDGQHRLSACVKSKTAVVSDIVFGLDDALFDVLDQGKKRSAGDVLGIHGIAYPSLVAGAIQWVLNFNNPTSVSMDGGGSTLASAREVLALAQGSMKDIAHYVNEALLINKAFAQPPTMICGLLYLIGKRDPSIARDFAHEWANGARIGRNRNFDVLNERIKTIIHGGGHVSRTMRTALIIQMFNHWNAHIIAPPRALTWRKGLRMPQLEFNAKSFKDGKDEAERADTSRATVKMRIMRVMTKKMSARNSEVAISLDTVAELANTSRRSASELVAELCREKSLIQVKEARRHHTARYQVIKPTAG